MKHKALVFTGFDVVLTLCVLLTTESRDADGLRFPASEERAAVRARENASFAGNRTNHARRATILSSTLVTNGVAKGARLNLAASVDDGVRLRNVRKTKRGVRDSQCRTKSSEATAKFRMRAKGGSRSTRVRRQGGLVARSKHSR